MSDVFFSIIEPNGKGAGGRKDFAQSGGSYNSNEDPLTKIKEFILSKV